jgi:hemerythrin-like domain-containing protein
MDILQEIKKDHDELKEIFKKLMSSKGKSAEKEFKELRKELLPHMKAEESIFYPALMDGKGREDALEGYEEHHASELYLREMEETSVQDERWNPKVKVLKEMIEHHIEEEESKIFKSASSELKKEQLKQLAEEFDAKKKELRKAVV